MTHPSVGAPGDPYRYGVYLRPDPHTCQAVTAVTAQLRAQYGLVSAGAFPPHATLIGSQHVPGGEDDLVDALTTGLAGTSSFLVHNAGVRNQGVGVVFDVHCLADGTTSNEELVNLAGVVDASAGPLVTPAPHPALPRFERATFHAHLSLASHDLYDRADLREEVQAYIRGLSVQHPATFVADTVTLYRTRSDDWAGRWWRSLTWTHVHTWRLGR
jgi:2'-5' RNA ligase superfamily